MKVNQLFTTNPDQALMSPFRDTNGVTLAFRTGDFCHPIGAGNWFTPPFFTKVLRFYCYIPLPFISYRIGKHAGYAGAKAYGADSDAYKNWMNPADVYDGSQAIMISIRPLATLP